LPEATATSQQAPTKKPFAVIETEKGRIVAELFPEVAPKTVANFIKLAEQGFYNGLTWHRVVPGFVIHGGDPLGNGTGGPGYTIPAEFNSKKHLKGTACKKLLLNIASICYRQSYTLISGKNILQGSL